MSINQFPEDKLCSPSLATAARGNLRRVGIGEGLPDSTGGRPSSLFEPGSTSVEGSPNARPADALDELELQSKAMPHKNKDVQGCE